MVRKQYIASNYIRRQSADWKTGKKNMVFGFTYLVFTMILGLYLNARITGGSEFLIPADRSMLSSALLYANIDAVLNIAVGYLICRLPFVDWLGKSVSALMLVGAILHSGMLYAAGLGFFPFATALLPVGIIMIAIVVFVMSLGVISLKTIK